MLSTIWFSFVIMADGIELIICFFIILFYNIYIYMYFLLIIDFIYLFIADKFSLYTMSFRNYI